MSKKKDSGTERHIASNGPIRKNDNFNESRDKPSGQWVMSDNPPPPPPKKKGK